MDSILSFASSMFQDSSSLYYLAGGAFLIVFLYLLSRKAKGKAGAKPKKGAPAGASEAPVSDEEVVGKKMAKLAAKAAKEARKKAEAAAKLERKQLAGRVGKKGFQFGRKKGQNEVHGEVQGQALEPGPAPMMAQALAPPQPTFGPPPPVFAPAAPPKPAVVGWPPRPAMHPGATVLAQAVLPVAETMAAPLLESNFRAVQLKAADLIPPAPWETASPPPPILSPASITAPPPVSSSAPPPISLGAAPPPVLKPAEGGPPPPISLGPAPPPVLRPAEGGPPPLVLKPAEGAPPPPISLGGPPPPVLKPAQGGPPPLVSLGAAPPPVLKPAQGGPPPLVLKPAEGGPPPITAKSEGPAPAMAPPKTAPLKTAPPADLKAPLPSAPSSSPGDSGVRIGGSGAKLSSDNLSPPEVVPIGDSEPVEVVELRGPAASNPVPVAVPSDPDHEPSLGLEPAHDEAPPEAAASEPEPLSVTAVSEIEEMAEELPQEAGAAFPEAEEAAPAAEDYGQEDGDEDGDEALEIGQTAQLDIKEQAEDALELDLDGTNGSSFEEALSKAASDLELVPASLAAMSEPPAAPSPPEPQAPPAAPSPPEPKAPEPKAPPAASAAPPLAEEPPDSPRAATQVVRPPESFDPVNARPMTVLESRGGILLASQTQMTSPIQIDQTQMPKVMKDALSGPAAASGQGVTIQDLDVVYERNTFLTPLEVVYYKLLRSAFTQFLIFPKVTSRAAVSVSSRNQEHLKVAENVLTNTSISFLICDVKLNIKAVVQLVDDSQPPSNKDKARDYILKRAGCVLVRFYSGDTPPDVATLRRLLLE
jgi:hypothetical protein